ESNALLILLAITTLAIVPADLSSAGKEYQDFQSAYFLFHHLAYAELLLAYAELRFIIINLLNFLLQRYNTAKVRNEIMCKMVSYSDLKLHKPLLISQIFRILAT
ncbi:hypothetical protein, partial [Xylanibacter rarus]|uniref:hypothetical protein n=1 Tax=Xylanibacter rarus TaxID=1676614 RepID=UPI003FD88E42